MTGISSKISHILPHRSKSTGSRSSSPTGGKAGSCRSQIASSCELFSLFKALAASETGSDADGDYAVSSESRPVDLLPKRAFAEDQDPLALPPSPATEKRQKDDLNNWLQEHLDKADIDREKLSASLAALSVSNMAPGEELSEVPSEPATPVEAPETIAKPTRKQSPMATTDDYDLRVEEGDISDAVKIQAIIEEFGDIASLMEPPPGQTSPEPERIVAECKGSVFKGVMIIGNLHLTTHRLLFHAVLPPEHALLNTTSSDAEPAGTADQQVPAHPDIVMAGPVTAHRWGPLSARRIWMEITPEMITAYPSADDNGRVRPLRSILLSSVKTMAPFDPEHPCDFHLYYETVRGPRSTYLSVDTEQSASQWRRSLEAALFQQTRRKWRENISLKRKPIDPEQSPPGTEWQTIRSCIPLDRSRLEGISNYHDFATLASLDVLLDGQHVQFRPEDIAAGDFSGCIDSYDESVGPETTPKPKLSFLKPTRSFSRSSKTHDTEREPILHRALTRKLDGASTPEKRTGSPGPPLRDSSQLIESRILHDPEELVGPESVLKTDDGASYYHFKVAVLNAVADFTTSLHDEIEIARQRKYRPGVEHAKMRLEIAGYDVLAADDDDIADETSTLETPNHSSDEVDEDSGGLLTEMRKAEKASLAAKAFGLREDEGIYLKRCYVINGVVPARGHIILTRKFVCFWRRAAVGADIKYRFPIEEVKGAVKAPSLRHGFHGMALNLHGLPDLKFEFWSKKSRNEVIERIQGICGNPPADISRQASELSTTATERAPSVANTANLFGVGTESPATMSLSDKAEQPVQVGSRTSTPVPSNHPADILMPPRDAKIIGSAFPDAAMGHIPFIANTSINTAFRLTPRHFACLTIGSRGDVQPYIALGLRLMQDGHKVTIVTHPEFKDWIEGYGIGHRPAGGDPTALMKFSAEHKMFSPGFFKESLGYYRDWLDELLLDSWLACQDADVLIESPSTMSGIHIAEGLKIPYFRAFTMPWTRTTAYPQAFMVPAFEMGPSFNYSTYVLFDNIMWRATAGQINRWRKKHLHLPATDMAALSITKVPFLYNFSSAVVPKPLDWHDDITITGYWYLDNSDAEWTPPESLDNFISQAKADGKPIVYIGFGSIVVPKPEAMTKSIIAAVEKAGVRAIIAKGWSARGAAPSEEEEIVFPPSCYSVDKVPHGWLFPKINAALHHGGAGTVGASLRAGLPTLIKPWFGDQFFWAGRVTRLGVGVKVSSLRSDEIADAITQATHDRVMIEKAARIGARIRAENGVDNAIRAISINIRRAASDRTKIKWGK